MTMIIIIVAPFLRRPPRKPRSVRLRRPPPALLPFVRTSTAPGFQRRIAGASRRTWIRAAPSSRVATGGSSFGACYELCRLTQGLRRRCLIIQPSEEAEGNRSVRRAGEKVAELARLRRRRLISQPRVAELARLPWVSERVALNPAMGFTPCAQGCVGGSARGRMEQSEEALKDPRDNHLPIPKGLNRCGGVELKTRGFGETLGRVGRRVHPGAQGTLPIGTPDQQQRLPTKPYAHGVQPFAGLSAMRLETQGSLASSATLG